MDKSYLMIVLHAHFPSLLTKNSKFERLFFEHLTDSLLPFLLKISANDSKQPLTIAFSPSYLENLSNKQKLQQYQEYLRKRRLLIHKELEKSLKKEERELLAFYEERIKRLIEYIASYNGQILPIIAESMDKGKITGIASLAAYLPYIQSEQGLRMHVEYSLNAYEKHFGVRSEGCWIPYGIYSPSLDRILSQSGINYSFVNGKVLQALSASHQMNAPIISQEGVALFPLSSKLGEIIDGFSSHSSYRDPLSDIAYERKWEYLAEFTIWEDIRYPTGIKMKQKGTNRRDANLYNRSQALFAVQQHLKEFNLQIDLEIHNEKNKNLYTISSSIDFFGNEWFEGLEFLHILLNKDFNHHTVMALPGEILSKLELYTHAGKSTKSKWLGIGSEGTLSTDILQEHYRQLLRMEQILLMRANAAHDSNQRLVKTWIAANDYWLHEQCKEDKESLFFQAALFSKQCKAMASSSNNGEKRFFIQANDIDRFYSNKPAHNHLIHAEKMTGNRHRIMMLSWEYPPSIVGGLGRHVWELSHSLAKEGHEVYVITPSFVGAPSYERINNIHVYRVKEIFQSVQNYHLLIARTNLNIVECAQSLIKQAAFTLIHAHDWMVGLAARMIKKTFSLPLISTIHALENGRNMGKELSSNQQRTVELEKALIMESDGIIVCSSYMEEEIDKILPSIKKNISVIPNGAGEMQACESSSIRHLLKRYEDHPVILAMGRIVKEKGFDTFIKAAAHVLQTIPDCLFIVAGKGPLLFHYQEQVEKLGLGKSIVFIGYLYDREKAAMLHYCDMLVVPSLYEPFGIVALEGMAAGKPVIVSKTGGLASIIEDEVTGMHFPPGDDMVLANKMKRLLDSPFLQKELGEKGRQKAKEKYRWEDVRKHTVAVYDHTSTTSSVQ